MQIVVRPYLFLREILGCKEITLEMPPESDLSALLTTLRSRYGFPDHHQSDYGRVVFFEDNNPVGLTILIDGRNIKQLQGGETLLNEGSVVTIFPPSAGG